MMGTVEVLSKTDLYFFCLFVLLMENLQCIVNMIVL